MAGSFNYAFTVGGNFNVVSPTFLSATVNTNVPATVPLPQNSNVSSVVKTNPTFTFVWDTPIDYASLLAGTVYLTDTSNTHINIPITFTQSLDQTTVTAQVNGTLTGSTQYRIWIYYNVRPMSITGVFDNSQRQFPFTTEP